MQSLLAILILSVLCFGTHGWSPVAFHQRRVLQSRQSTVSSSKSPSSPLLTPRFSSTFQLFMAEEGGGDSGGKDGGDGGGEREKSTKGGRKVALKERVEEEVQAKAKEKISDENQWRVLLHNDEIHTFDYVTHSIVKIVKQLTRKKAHQITVQTHSAGMATVIIVWKDLAEKYCMGLQRQGLTASIAPDSGFKKNDGGDGGDGGDGPSTD
ncbi:hypothetical protein TrLO_g2054 [Triparma laevis f. longispina]|uniref:Adaptor protein ClpS core domain-containing protein n=1 Tax=Triparma laevis f. longispina TaxID=1714387 RepID=A0A9W7FBV2_9STRA|nr:hypothetical protein TrLO_g2054 [Triparma laevis f. longispina]